MQKHDIFATVALSMLKTKSKVLQKIQKIEFLISEFLYNDHWCCYMSKVFTHKWKLLNVKLEGLFMQIFS